MLWKLLCSITIRCDNAHRLPRRCLSRAKPWQQLVGWIGLFSQRDRRHVIRQDGMDIGRMSAFACLIDLRERTCPVNIAAAVGLPDFAALLISESRSGVKRAVSDAASRNLQFPWWTIISHSPFTPGDLRVSWIDMSLALRRFRWPANLEASTTLSSACHP